MNFFGYALIAVAIIWFVYKMYVSYTSAGGTDFAMPVYDAALYPPIMVAVGLYLLMRSGGEPWSIWVYVVIAVLTAGLTAGLIRLMEELGDKPL